MNMKSLFLFLGFIVCFGCVRAQDSFLNPTDSVVLKSLSYSTVGYPKEALENGIEGTVYVAFDIDSTCAIVNVRILRGIGYGCDEQALEVIQKAKGELLKENLEECTRLDVRIPIHFQMH